MVDKPDNNDEITLKTINQISILNGTVIKQVQATPKNLSSEYILCNIRALTSANPTYTRNKTHMQKCSVEDAHNL